MLARALPALLLLAPLAAAGTLHVPADFGTLQDAADAAATGDTIVVHKGSYAESVAVTGKTGLLIRGAGQPVIDATGLDIGLTLDGCSDVEVRGLRFAGATDQSLWVKNSSTVQVHHCRVDVPLAAGSAGIRLSATTDVEVHHCDVAGALLAGILVETSTGAHVHHNDVIGMKSGGWPEAAVRVGDSDHVTVEHNTLSFVISGVRFFSDSAPGV